MRLLSPPYLIRNEAVRLTMHRFGRRFAWGLHEAEHFTRSFIEPILEIADAVLALHNKVALVRTFHRGERQSFDKMMRVHEKWHGLMSLLSACHMN